MNEYLDELLELALELGRTMFGAIAGGVWVEGGVVPAVGHLLEAGRHAVADDGHGLAFDDAQVTVFIVINLHDFSWVIKGWERDGLNQIKTKCKPCLMQWLPVISNS